MSAQIIPFPNRGSFPRRPQAPSDTGPRLAAVNYYCDPSPPDSFICDHNHMVLRAEGWRCAKCSYVFGKVSQ